MKRLFLLLLLSYAFFALASCTDATDTPLTEMITVPSGSFSRGSDVDPVEQPLTSIYLERFYIDEFEVSNLQYKFFVDRTNRTAPSDWINSEYEAAKENHPVKNVTWDDAAAYCAWANKRLPTESEWEKAARGPSGNSYPWGEVEPTEELANFAHNIGAAVDVSSYQNGKSYYGAYNMAGNVWEWTSSWYKPYDGAEESDSDSDFDEAYKVLKGGGWNSAAISLRGAARGRSAPDEALDTVGFRCAK